MDEKFWKKVARYFIRAGVFPFPLNDTVIELTKTLVTEDEAKFITNFKKSSMNIEQLKKKTNMDEKSLESHLNPLMDKGIIVKSQSKTTGIIVYNLMPFLPGIFEYSFMKGNTGEREKKLAVIYEQLFDDMRDLVQNNYDNITEQYKKQNFADRVIPVEKFIDDVSETVVPYEEVKKLVDNAEIIAISNCYCRHHKDLLGVGCKINAPKLNCFQLGKNAKFAIEHGFAQPVSKERAMKILHEAEDHGLIHKAIHVNLDPSRTEAAICNCCKCCCDTIQLYYRGINAIKSLTSYIARVDEEKCVGCGNCVEICPLEAPVMDDDKAKINENKCIGCGVCAHHCPEGAIVLDRTGPRYVFIPPVKVGQN